MEEVSKMTLFRNLSDTDFGNLNASKNKYVMKYNATTKKFELVSTDSALSLSSDPPQPFVDTIESEVNVANIALSNADGGTF